jgi:hypothetical protein
MKNYKLLTHAIITALDASNPSMRGTVWTPEDKIDVLEAEALARIGLAKETTEKATHQTVSARAAGKPPKVPLSGSVDATLQEDGTFKNKNGVRVNKDGSEYDGEEDVEVPLAELLDGNVTDVTTAIDETELSAEQLAALRDLEQSGKNRKTVLDHIQLYIEAE